MGDAGRAAAAAAGPRHRPQPARTRDQRRPRSGPRRRPAGRSDRERGQELRADARAGDRDRRRRVRARGSATAASRRRPSTSPGSAPRGSTPTTPRRRSGVRARRLRSADEAPFEAFADAGGELVMLGLATYPALADRPGGVQPQDRHRRAAPPGGLRGGQRSPTPSTRRPRPASARRERVALAAAGAGSDLLLYGDWRTAREVEPAAAPGPRRRRARSRPLRGFRRAGARAALLPGRLGPDGVRAAQRRGGGGSPAPRATRSACRWARVSPRRSWPPSASATTGRTCGSTAPCSRSGPSSSPATGSTTSRASSARSSARSATRARRSASPRRTSAASPRSTSSSDPG